LTQGPPASPNRKSDCRDGGSWFTHHLRASDANL
jgi:hypothetical protein